MEEDCAPHRRPIALDASEARSKPRASGTGKKAANERGYEMDNEGEWKSHGRGLAAPCSKRRLRVDPQLHAVRELHHVGNRTAGALRARHAQLHSVR